MLRIFAKHRAEKAEKALCQICLDHMDGGVLGMAVEITCGHAFHAACLAHHIRAKCEEAIATAENELRAREDELGLDDAAREEVLGGATSLADLSSHDAIRQCPSCDYGPVVNLNCDDMVSHDAGRGSGSGRTTNSCPKCGFFSENWDDWKLWDSARPTSAVLCPLCRCPCQMTSAYAGMIKERLDDVDSQLEEVSVKLFDAPFRSVDLLVLMLVLQAELDGFKPFRVICGSRNRKFFDLLPLPDAVASLLADSSFRSSLERRAAIEEEIQVLRQLLECKGRMAALDMDPSCVELAGLDQSVRLTQQRIQFLNKEISSQALELIKGAGRAKRSSTGVPLLQQRRDLLDQRARWTSLLHTIRGDLDAVEVRRLGRPWLRPDVAPPQVGDRVAAALTYIQQLGAAWHESFVQETDDLNEQMFGHESFVQELQRFQARLLGEICEEEGIRFLGCTSPGPWRPNDDDAGKTFVSRLILDLLAPSPTTASVFSMLDIPGMMN